MSDKNILLDTLRHKSNGEKLAWVPFAGVHAGKLIGKNAIEVLTDEDALFESLMAVNRLYHPQGQPVVFDLQIEAEILGCELLWVEDCPPSVKTHPLAQSMTVPCRCTIPAETDGRIPLVCRTIRRMKEAVGEDTALYALVCGPFTLASHLRGNDLFMDMYDDEDYVKELLSYCADCAKAVAGYYMEAGADIIAVVDPLVSQISRSHFEDFLSDPYKDIFSYIRDSGAFSSFFVCGDASRNMEPMCLCAPDSISVDENVDLKDAKNITDKYNVAIGGNIPLTSIMLHGTQQDNMKYVIDLLDSIDDLGNLIIAPGCDMPYDVPVENGIAVAQAVANTKSCREMLKNYVAEDITADIELPRYDELVRPLIEVFTLDSDTCAACTYMLGAAKAAKDRFGEAVDMVEYKYTVKENIARCRKMGIKSLPSIYINGKLCFASIIPSADELDTAIKEALK